jgi:hypothetical protein
MINVVWYQRHVIKNLVILEFLGQNVFTATIKNLKQAHMFLNCVWLSFKKSSKLILNLKNNCFAQCNPPSLARKDMLTNLNAIYYWHYLTKLFNTMIINWPSSSLDIRVSQWGWVKNLGHYPSAIGRCRCVCWPQSLDGSWRHLCADFWWSIRDFRPGA